MNGTAFDRRRPELCRNLRKQWKRIDDVDRIEGSGWYPLAQGIVRQWSKHYGYTVDTVAAVVAAISPQVEWTRNLVIADDVLAHRPPSIGGVLHVNLRKAEQLRDKDRESIQNAASIAHGLPVWTLRARMGYQFPTGPKVLNFALNLAGDMDAVTIDTHAFQCALDDPLSTIGIRPIIYAVVADCYRTVADELAISPATFQAVLWHYWKRRYPRTWKLQQRRQWHVVGDY